MATRTYENIAKNTETEVSERLVGETEILVDEADSRKDLKESRKIIKEHYYVGPSKLKHMLPKGKHL